VREIQLDGSAGASVDMSAEGGFARWLRGKADLNASADVKAQKKYESTKVLDKNLYRLIWVYSLHEPGSSSEVDVTYDAQCPDKDPVYGIDGDVQTKIRIADLKTALPDLAAALNTQTGRADLRCYGDYLDIRSAVQNKATGDIDIFLTRFVRIQDTDSFFVCKSHS
jgi:hypothetical protein